MGISTLVGITSLVALPASSLASTAPQAGNTLTPSEALSAGRLTAITDIALPKGGTQYRYNFRSGSSLTSVTPPAGFSPLTATSTQLNEYGFPARPSTASGLAEWYQAMTDWRSAVAPKLLFSTSPIAPFPSGGPALNSTANGNWSGYDVNATTQAWAGAQGEFAVPGIGTACGQSSVMSIWTGIGGKNSSQLIQSGLAFNENISGQISLWTPFFEVLNSSYQNPPYELYGAYNRAIVVNSGDLVISDTQYHPSTGNASYYLEDLTTGQSASFTQTGVSSYYDGSTAEWISEFPNSVGAQFTAFAIVNISALNNNGNSYNFYNAGNQSFYVPGREEPGGVGSSGNSFAEYFDGC
ncbi:MAG: G1 family glutamic endopeptidase [Ferrimicrobium sp.]